MDPDPVPTPHAIAGFLPSIHGLRFANAFPPGPTVRLGPLDVRWFGVGDASAGLCGGMSLTVRDLFEAGIPVPSDTAPPANGSPRFRALVRRQVESLDWLRVPLRFWIMQALHPDAPTGIAGRVATALRLRPAAGATADREWPRARASLDAGRLAVIGLVRSSGPSLRRLAVNHQVLAWAYAEAPGIVRLWICDPNHPGRDDVTIDLVRAPGPASASQSTGEPLRGFLDLPYPAGDVRAWRQPAASRGAGDPAD